MDNNQRFRMNGPRKEDFFEKEEESTDYDKSFTPNSTTRNLTNLPAIFRCNTGDSSDGATSFDSVLTTGEISAESEKICAMLSSVREKTSSSSGLRTEVDISTLISQYLQCLEECEATSEASTAALRDLVLTHGLPAMDNEVDAQRLRARVWMSLLGVRVTPTDEAQYASKCNDETSGFDAKIKNDAFRTFKGNEQFWRVVDEGKITRVLRALSFDVGYVQGMNVLLGPFLMTMSEIESFVCFRELITRRIPSYVTKNLDGVHRAIALSTRCMAVLDPQLHRHINSKLHTMSVFSVKYILTMMASTQPLDEVLRIWDAVFAFGTQLSLLVFFAFLISMRDELLASVNANKMMRVIDGHTLQSELMVKLALELGKTLPADLLEEIRVHGV